MCPACLCGVIAAGPDDFRGPSLQSKQRSIMSMVAGEMSGSLVSCPSLSSNQLSLQMGVAFSFSV